MQPKYEVPIIPHNLRREETIVQVAEALQYLSEVSSDIFKRIDARIAQNKTQVNNISERIATASTKLNKLAGAKKATQVFSSSKYPGENINRQYKSIFDNKEVLPVKKFDYEYKSSQVGDEQLEALQFYYVKVKSKSERHNVHGLGDPPSDIETINDMLLFNTGRNAYSKDGIHDRLNSSVLNASKRGKDDSEVDIGAAPFSISQGQGLGMQKTIGENYFYSPHLGNVPTIDVPLDLPDLPGIADDLRYQTELEPNIAPSVAIINPQLANAIPDLPEIEDVSDDKENDVKVQSVTVQVVSAPAQAPLRIATTNIPAGHDAEQAKQVNSTPSAAMKQEQSDNTKTTNIARNEKVEKATTSKEVVKQAAPALGGDNSRASLMEAIRMAGGSKNLKPKKEMAQNNKEPAPTGDLMADLHAKLSMRRKGISGNKVDNPSAMDKISEMIPPPPATQSDKSQSAEEDDWDDD